MIKRTLFVLYFGFVLIVSKAQQVYECKSLGFKFVMECECIEQNITHPVVNKKYEMLMVPEVTYIEKGSPAEIIPYFIRRKIFQIGNDTLYNKTPEQIVALFENPKIIGKQIVFSSYYNYNETYSLVPYFSAPVIFSEPKYNPVKGGGKLLASIIGKYEKKGELLVLYENGDEWHGQVINKMYPDYSDSKGKYWPKDSIMKLHYLKNKVYQDSMAIVKAKADEDLIIAKINAEQQKIYYARQKIIQDSMIKINMAKWAEDRKVDSINNLKSARQLIAMISDSAFENHLKCGIGIDIKKLSDRWDITEVEKYSGAWFAGLKVGDQLDFKNNGWNIYTSKLEIMKTFCKSMGTQVGLYFSRGGIPNEYVGGKSINVYCITPYNLPPSLKHGGCLTGDCINGIGVFMDEKKSLFFGSFKNGKLNQPDLFGAKIISPSDSSITTSYFIDGKKNGPTIISHGRALVSYDWNGWAWTLPNAMHCPFKNDVPDGTAEFDYGFGVAYYAKYINGVAQGRALQIVSDKQYKYCDISSSFELSNCFIYDGVPSDVSMIPINNPIVNNNINSINNGKGFNFGGENVIPNLRLACEAVEKLEIKSYTWHDGGSLTFEPSGVYDVQYVRITVPANKKLVIYFAMEPGETNKMQFLPKHLSYLYEKTDGGIPAGYSNDVGGAFYMQTFAILNNYNKEGWVTIEIRGHPSTEYVRRAIYYVWGISN